MTDSEINWETLGLAPTLLTLITKEGFTKPTPVQAQSIPPGLAGQDVIASAQTGTGKTAAFVLPMVQKFMGREGTYGLILAPTREIALQTRETLEKFGTPLGVRAAVLIGGVDMKLDIKALATYPQIIVATPGRLCDHLDRGNIWLDFIQTVVLDEADRMLDMGFSDQLNRILQETPREKQTLLFSATIPRPVEDLARRTLHDPVRVMIGKPTSAATTVEQNFVHVEERDKMRELMRLLANEKGSVFIFSRSKERTSELWRRLHSYGVYDAVHLHSGLRQKDREKALEDFKGGTYRILIATDVVGRGVHVDDVAHVVNYDIPLEPEDYIHRIGRTGRAGGTGRATSFVTPRDRGLVRQIEQLIGKEPSSSAPPLANHPSRPAPHHPKRRPPRGRRH